MKSSAIRNAASLTVILSLLGPVPLAGASPSSPSLSIDPIASGVITNVHGQADPNGEVYVFALPDQSKLIGAPPGKSIPLTLVGYARTSAQGKYAVNAQPASLMKTNGQHGYVNLQAIAVSGSKAAGWDYSVLPTGAAWRVEGGTASEPALSFNFATNTAPCSRNGRRFLLNGRVEVPDHSDGSNAGLGATTEGHALRLDYAPLFQPACDPAALLGQTRSNLLQEEARALRYHRNRIHRRKDP